MDSAYYRLAASCAIGMEGLVTGEVESFEGRNIRQSPGLVSWEGALASGYRACLWSRFASRVFLELESFDMADESVLYGRSRDVAWQDHLELETTFAIDCTLSGEPFSSTVSLPPYDSRMRLQTVSATVSAAGRRSIPTLPGFASIYISRILSPKSPSIFPATVCIGGDIVSAAVPPRSRTTLAAALVALSGWTDHPGEALLDPMCGTGSLLIEAALMFGDSAPGLSRNRFGFMGWRQHDASLWETLVDEAIAREEAGLSQHWPRFLGYDADPAMVTAAKMNIARAGLADHIEIRQGEIARLESPGGSGMLLTNLPFGERLLEKEEVALL